MDYLIGLTIQLLGIVTLVRVLIVVGDSVVKQAIAACMWWRFGKYTKVRLPVLTDNSHVVRRGSTSH